LKASEKTPRSTTSLVRGEPAIEKLNAPSNARFLANSSNRCDVCSLSNETLV
jgi:hypothetical protein